MRATTPALVAVLLLAFGAAGCSPERTAATRSGQAVTALDRRAPGEVIVDLRPNGEMLVGRVIAPPPDSDADRTQRVRWLTAAGERQWAFSGTPILEARFMGDSGALLVLTTDHRLLRVDRDVALLDREAHGPISLDARGARAVYTRGDAPTTSLIRAELATGKTEVLAPGLSSVWSPALSADGTEVVFVASTDGTPALWRQRDGEAPARWALPAETALPTGPTAPVIFGAWMVYESDGSLCALGLDGVAHTSRRGLGLPLHVAGSPTMLAQSPDGTLTTLRPGDLEAR